MLLHVVALHAGAQKQRRRVCRVQPRGIDGERAVAGQAVAEGRRGIYLHAVRQLRRGGAQQQQRRREHARTQQLGWRARGVQLPAAPRERCSCCDERGDGGGGRRPAWVASGAQRSSDSAGGDACARTRALFAEAARRPAPTQQQRRGNACPARAAAGRGAPNERSRTHAGDGSSNGGVNAPHIAADCAGCFRAAVPERRGALWEPNAAVGTAQSARSSYAPGGARRKNRAAQRRCRAGQEQQQQLQACAVRHCGGEARKRAPKALRRARLRVLPLTRRCHGSSRAQRHAAAPRRLVERSLGRAARAWERAAGVRATRWPNANANTARAPAKGTRRSRGQPGTRPPGGAQAATDRVGLTQPRSAPSEVSCRSSRCRQVRVLAVDVSQPRSAAAQHRRWTRLPRRRSAAAARACARCRKQAAAEQRLSGRATAARGEQRAARPVAARNAA